MDSRLNVSISLLQILHVTALTLSYIGYSTPKVSLIFLTALNVLLYSFIFAMISVEKRRKRQQRYVQKNHAKELERKRKYREKNRVKLLKKRQELRRKNKQIRITDELESQAKREEENRAILNNDGNINEENCT